MKIRSLLTIVAMFSLLLIGIGTAHAELGVNDMVPGRDTVIPIICSTNIVAGTENGTDTLWAIADTSQGAVHFADSTDVVREKVVVYTIKSEPLPDFTEHWTLRDVITNACSTVVTTKFNPADQNKLRVSMNPTTGLFESDPAGDFYMGYIVYANQSVPPVCGPGLNQPCPPSDRFISWAYLTDLSRGFASGFNPYSVEQGLSATELAENNGVNPITAESLQMRYFLMNNQPNSMTWWIVLAGRNEYAINHGLLFDTHRSLDCQICNEEEVCNSGPIPIPFELNVIDSSAYLASNLLNSSGKFAGFVMCHITESGDVLIPTPGTVTIFGTADVPAFAPNPTPLYTIKGWSYQKAESSAQLSWDAMLEMHRLYCNGQTNNPQTEGPCGVK